MAARSNQSSASSTSSMSLSSPSNSPPSPTTPMSPGSPRAVRFEERCVLIPESSLLAPPKGPRIITKSYSLPIVPLPWKWGPFGRDASAQGVAPAGKEKDGPSERVGREKDAIGRAGAGPESDHVIVKVPFPAFSRKTSKSPLRHPDTCPLPPCLVHRHEPPLPTLSDSLSSKYSLYSSPPKRPQDGSNANPPKRRLTRSSSLPPTLTLETIPLNPCCDKCLPACAAPTLPPVEESPRESTGELPLKGAARLYPHSHVSGGGMAEDWCAGMHFTKGALRRRRSASVENGVHGLLGTLVRVDEVDRKRGKSPPRASNACLARLKTDCAGKARGENGSAGSGGSEEDSELFPLPSPSPKRTPSASPVPSPGASASNLLGSGAATEPAKLERAIREKIVTGKSPAGARLSPSSASPTELLSGNRTPPIPIPRSPSSKLPSSQVVSRFSPHRDELVYDPTLPDPDALPAGSTILLNSPPSSPPRTRGPGPTPTPSSMMHASASTSSLKLARSISPPYSLTGASGRSMSPPRSGSKRRPSISAGAASLVRAGVGALKGISLSTNAPSQSNYGYTNGVAV